MKAYIEMMRPNNGVLAVLGIIIGAIVAGTFAASYAILFAVIVSFLINGAGNVINDYFDHKIDKINRPKRPIPSGRVKRDSALMYFIALTLVGLMLSYFISRDFLLIAVINTIVSFVYSWKLKGAPFIGNVAVSWLAGSTFIAAALIGFNFSSVPQAVMILAVIAFLGTLSREIFKDIEDVKGDKSQGAKTLPIVVGSGRAKFVASLVLLLSVFSLLVPFYLRMFSDFYYICMVPAIALCLYSIVAKSAHKSQKMIKISMYFIFLGFILGTLI